MPFLLPTLEISLREAGRDAKLRSDLVERMGAPVGSREGQGGGSLVKREGVRPCGEVRGEVLRKKSGK